MDGIVCANEVGIGLCSQQLWPLVPALLPGAASCFHLRQLRRETAAATPSSSLDQLPVNWSPHIRLETNILINILCSLYWQIWKGFNDLILLFLVWCFCHISELTKSTSKLWSWRKGCSKNGEDVVWERMDTRESYLWKSNLVVLSPPLLRQSLPEHL